MASVTAEHKYQGTVLALSELVKKTLMVSGTSGAISSSHKLRPNHCSTNKNFPAGELDLPTTFTTLE